MHYQKKLRKYKINSKVNTSSLEELCINELILEKTGNKTRNGDKDHFTFLFVSFSSSVSEPRALPLAWKIMQLFSHSSRRKQQAKMPFEAYCIQLV